MNQIKIIAAIIAVFLPETLLGLSNILAPIKTLVDYLMYNTSGGDGFFVIYGLLLFGIPLIGFIILAYKSFKVKKLWLKITLLSALSAILIFYLTPRSLLWLMALQR